MEDFGFEVQVRDDLNKPDFLRELKTIGGYSKEQYDCIVLAILSHGKESKWIIFISVNNNNRIGSAASSIKPEN